VLELVVFLLSVLVNPDPSVLQSACDWLGYDTRQPRVRAAIMRHGRVKPTEPE
jgi:hypothetical protein